MAAVQLKLPGSDKIFEAPDQETAQRALSEGYELAAEDEVSRYDAAKKYHEETPELARQGLGLAVGATQQVLALPGLATGSSGGELLAELSAKVTGLSPDETAEALRQIAEQGSAGHLAGQIGGALVGAKGLSAAGTGLAAKAGVGITEGMGLAGSVAESVATNISFMNENAYIKNQDLTAEQIMFASLMGGIGPVGSKLIGTAAKRGAGALDARRIARFEQAGPTWYQGLMTGAKPPAKFTDLFSASAPTKWKALSELAGEAATGAEAAGKAYGVAAQSVGSAVAGAVRGAKLSPAMIGGFGGAGGLRGIFGAMVGGAAGEAVRRFGPAAGGWAMRNMAETMRKVAADSAKRAVSGASKSVSPRDIIGSLASGMATQAYRNRVGILFDAGRDAVTSTAANEVEFIEGIGEAYSGFPPEMVGAITKQQMRTISYLQTELPPQPLLVPGMPQLGRKKIPIGEQEKYIRKMAAVQNPFLLMDELERGKVNKETVDAVKAVYPSFYLDLQASVLQELGSAPRALSRDQAIAMDKIMAGATGKSGLVYGASNPGFQARLDLANQAKGSQGAQAASGGQQSAPGKAPSLAQDMRTGTQSAIESIGN